MRVRNLNTITVFADNRQIAEFCGTGLEVVALGESREVRTLADERDEWKAKAEESEEAEYNMQAELVQLRANLSVARGANECLRNECSRLSECLKGGWLETVELRCMQAEAERDEWKAKAEEAQDELAKGVLLVEQAAERLVASITVRERAEKERDEWKARADAMRVRAEAAEEGYAAQARRLTLTEGLRAETLKTHVANIRAERDRAIVQRNVARLGAAEWRAKAEQAEAERDAMRVRAEAAEGDRRTLVTAHMFHTATCDELRERVRQAEGDCDEYRKQLASAVSRAKEKIEVVASKLAEDLLRGGL